MFILPSRPDSASSGMIPGKSGEKDTGSKGKFNARREQEKKGCDGRESSPSPHQTTPGMSSAAAPQATLKSPGVLKEWFSGIP